VPPTKLRLKDYLFTIPTINLTPINSLPFSDHRICRPSAKTTKCLPEVAFAVTSKSDTQAAVSQQRVNISPHNIRGLLILTIHPSKQQGICHCVDCRKLSGSPYTLNFLSQRSELEVNGEPKEIAKTADSGNFVKNYFCPDCGKFQFIIAMQSKSNRYE
jgi:hypothetical protein